jgi:hypothetical protein
MRRQIKFLYSEGKAFIMANPSVQGWAWSEDPWLHMDAL